MITTIRSGLVLVLVVALGAPLLAQRGGRGRGGPPPVPRVAAPVDLTGNWVSVVSEDWRWRMITPPKGDYANIPLNAEARAVADGWDPEGDEAAGEQCKGYAAPAIMREPGRLQISWEDDFTLKMETDAGMQIRTFRFARQGNSAGAAPAASIPVAERGWQGESVARWETPPRAPAGLGFSLGLGPRAGSQSRTLEVVTTQIRPGYLRKNGVPFSADTVVTEYYDMFKEPDGQDWFVVTTLVRDPQYLGEPWVTTSHFKREPDASKWNPTPCQVR